ncbi:MAG: phage late control D family protein [Thiomicrorhabdus sp.]|nr:phage late control D family protein [Thiomicrorhabdus sp.]
MNPEAIFASRDPNIEPNASIDQAVTIEIKHKYDPKICYLHGIVESLNAEDVSGGWAYYTLNIRSTLHRLSLPSNAQIF